MRTGHGPAPLMATLRKPDISLLRTAGVTNSPRPPRHLSRPARYL